MSININYQVHKAYNISGTNFQKGIKSGNFFVNQLNPGIDIGNVHAYTIQNPLQEGEITTLSGTGPSSTYFPLANVPETIGKIVTINVTEQALQFDYPRQLRVISDVPGTVTFSIIDRYGKEVVNVIELNQVVTTYVGVTNIGVNYLTSALFETTETGDFSVQLLTTNVFELPYTDCGKQVFLESVTASRQNGFYSDVISAIPLSDTSSITESAPYLYQLDIVYTPATWTNAITLTNGNPRPFVEFTLLGESIFFPTINPYSFMIKQNIFPYFQANLSNLITETQANNGTSTYGLPCLNTGFVGWRG